MSNIVKELTLLPNENRFSDFTLATVVYSRLGEVAFGTSPGYAEIMEFTRGGRASPLVQSFLIVLS